LSGEITVERGEEPRMQVIFRFTESPPALLHRPMTRVIEEFAREAGLSASAVRITKRYVAFVVSV
jgi:hypothetical protein